MLSLQSFQYKAFFQILWKSRCFILVTFPSHLKKLHSILRFWQKSWIVNFFTRFTVEKTPQNNFCFLSFFYSRALCKMVPLELNSLKGCCLCRRWSFLLSALRGKALFLVCEFICKLVSTKTQASIFFIPKKDYKNTCVLPTKAEWLLYLCNCFGLCKYT